VKHHLVRLRGVSNTKQASVNSATEGARLPF